jgi:type I restriction enzyme S subunit
MDIGMVPLGELTLKIGSGATPRGGKEAYKTEGIALFRSLNVYDLEFHASGLAYIDDEQAAQLSNVEVLPGDVLLNITGASVARCALAPSRLLPARVNQHVAILRPDPRILDGRFLNYVLVSPRHKGRLLAIAQGGATREALTKGALEQFDIPMPPLTVQRRIAAVLAAYDELIENNLRRIEIVEGMAQVIYREWFVNFRFPGHEDVALVDSPLGPIPDGWAVRKIVELAGGNEGVVGGPFGSKLGRKDYVEAGVPVIRGANLNGALGWNDDEFVFVSRDKFGELRGNAATRGDIIVTQRGTLGQVGLVSSAAPWPDLVVSQSQMRIRVDPGSSTTLFVFHSLRWPSTNQRLVDHAMSAGVPHINLGILRDFKFVVPPLPLAKAYDQLAGPMRRLAENLSAQNANLRSTRDLLLPKLVSGEVDVSELDIETEWLAS